MYTGQNAVLVPTQCTIRTNMGVPMINGSSEIVNNNCTSSVLFDRNNSSFTVDENMWASQLLTLRASSFARINFIFSEDSVYGIGRVEVMLFNCPQWGIGVDSITLAAENNNRMINTLAIDSSALASCESLVRVCMQYFTCSDTSFNMTFGLSNGSTWVHLAEVTFYDGWNATVCPPDAVLNLTHETSAPTMLISTNNPSPSGIYLLILVTHFKA